MQVLRQVKNGNILLVHSTMKDSNFSKNNHLNISSRDQSQRMTLLDLNESDDFHCKKSNFRETIF
jgi:hypothetical protein